MCIERTSSQTHKWLPWYAFLDVENPDLQTGENIPLKKKIRDPEYANELQFYVSAPSNRKAISSIRQHFEGVTLAFLLFCVFVRSSFKHQCFCLHSF